jgi:predicted HTH transcriptional regulator
MIDAVDWDDAAAVETFVDRLRALPSESNWVEFKVNNADPKRLGKNISALSNSAALEGKDYSFLVFGIRDSDHAVIGTTFDPAQKKIGNEDLTPWLLRLLSPDVELGWTVLKLGGKRVVVLRIAAANAQPVQFEGTEYIRIGSYSKPLKEHPDHARRLWRVIDAYSFEEQAAQADLSVEHLVELIDYPAYFALSRQPLPENRSHIIEALEGAGLIRYTVADQWQITNAAALLYAVELDRFPRLARKGCRVIWYTGTSRVRAHREQVGHRGYAVGFRGLVEFISNLLPQSEVIMDGVRMDNRAFPELAIRELIANALIHQDLTISGAGPMVEVFDDRLEITNPGRPLLDPLRFIDSAPRSRNEHIGRAMRNHGICEERGSGWDKVAFEVEFHQLPPPLVEVSGESIRVSLFAPRPLSEMDRPERLRAVYQHACLCWVSHQHTTNASVRKRFGIEKHNSAQASRIIREAVEERLIVAHDPSVGPRSLRYVPFLADPERRSVS